MRIEQTFSGVCHGLKHFQGTGIQHKQWGLKHFSTAELVVTFFCLGKQHFFFLYRTMDLLYIQ